MRQKEKTLALAILHVHRCNYGKARDLLAELGAGDLHDVLLENWELLFELVDAPAKGKVASTFSELTTVLMSVCPDTLSEILINLIAEKRVLSLGKMLKVRSTWGGRIMILNKKEKNIFYSSINTIHLVLHVVINKSFI